MNMERKYPPDESEDGEHHPKTSTHLGTSSPSKGKASTTSKQKLAASTPFKQSPSQNETSILETDNSDKSPQRKGKRGRRTKSNIMDIPGIPKIFSRNVGYERLISKKDLDHRLDDSTPPTDKLPPNLRNVKRNLYRRSRSDLEVLTSTMNDHWEDYPRIFERGLEGDFRANDSSMGSKSTSQRDKINKDDEGCQQKKSRGKGRNKYLGLGIEPYNFEDFGVVLSLRNLVQDIIDDAMTLSEARPKEMIDTSSQTMLDDGGNCIVVEELLPHLSNLSSVSCYLYMGDELMYVDPDVKMVVNATRDKFLAFIGYSSKIPKEFFDANRRLKQGVFYELVFNHEIGLGNKKELIVKQFERWHFTKEALVARRNNDFTPIPHYTPMYVNTTYHDADAIDQLSFMTPRSTYDGDDTIIPRSVVCCNIL